MPSEAINRATIREWRDLGFYYYRNDAAREWRLVGSRSGLLGFRDALFRYAADPRHSDIQNTSISARTCTSKS